MKVLLHKRGCDKGIILASCHHKVNSVSLHLECLSNRCCFGKNSSKKLEAIPTKFIDECFRNLLARKDH